VPQTLGLNLVLAGGGR